MGARNRRDGDFRSEGRGDELGTNSEPEGSPELEWRGAFGPRNESWSLPVDQDGDGTELLRGRMSYRKSEESPYEKSVLRDEGPTAEGWM